MPSKSCVIDDDVLVFPKPLSKALHAKDRKLVHGTPGCVVDITKAKLIPVEGIFTYFAVVGFNNWEDVSRI